MNMRIKSEEDAVYTVDRIVDEEKIIKQALDILHRRVKRGEVLRSSLTAKQYLQLQLKSCEQEIFCCLFLDNKNRVISFKKMFYGTINSAAVYPREVVKLALEKNAASVIFAHNHPSGEGEPSHHDEQITKRLKEALALVDINVRDHFIIGDDVFSFAERGLL